MEASLLFAETEGIVPAPETNHAIEGARDLALQCKQRDEEKVILFNFIGHRLLALKAYDDKLTGFLEKFEPDLSTIRKALESVPIVS